MAEQIRILGETFDQVVTKTIGGDYIGCGNTFWPTDQSSIVKALAFHAEAVPNSYAVDVHDYTAADYEFSGEKDIVLGPPQPLPGGSREDMIRQGYVGVYRHKPAP